jgi:hypothetical protein
MLRNKVGIKKMISSNGLVSLIPSVEYRDPYYSSEYGIQGIRKSSRRSRDPKRRDERILIVMIKGTEDPTTVTPTRPDWGPRLPLLNFSRPVRLTWLGNARKWRKRGGTK